MRGPATERLVLHVDDADVRKVLEMISRQGKVNILVSPSVTGLVTLDLRDMTVEEGLAAIARLCHLTVRRDNDLIYVYTKAEADQGDDLPVRVYHLNYARASDLEKMIKPLLSKRGVITASPDSEVGLKSDGNKAGTSSLGTTDVKGGGNSLASSDVLIVQDCDRVLQAVDRVVAQLDVQPVQVMIEAVDCQRHARPTTWNWGSTLPRSVRRPNGKRLRQRCGVELRRRIPSRHRRRHRRGQHSPAIQADSSWALPSTAAGHLHQRPGRVRARLQVRLQSATPITAFIRALETRHDVKVLASSPPAGGQQAAC